MKLPCSVIQDLLPLYAEDLTSDVSKTLVEEHLPACEDCRKRLEELKAPPPALPPEAVPMQQVKKLLRKQTLAAILLVFFLTTALSLVVLGHMTAPEPVDSNAVAFYENNNGFFSFRITHSAPAGTKLQMDYFTDENGRNCVAISPYISPWLRIFGKNTDGTIITTDRGNLDLAYYCNQRKGGTLQMLYPMRIEPNLGAALPRLTLNYYLFASFALAVVFSFILRIQHNKNSGLPFLYLALVFICYVAAHLLMKGLDGSSYFLLQDLAFILLTAAALFGAACTALTLYRLRKDK